ncbi:MAG TPA: lipid II flippase MurJ [Micromonosporaceae bacterium]|nr:lipid II flippase MurJ [Micromonosporaceae bacterium]
MSIRNDQVREATPGLIVRATALAAALTVLGNLLGLLRDLSLARLFGATSQTDAFLVAWTVPETASPLLIEGAMTFLMVPIFVRALADRGDLGAVVRSTLPRIAGLLAIVTTAVAVAAPLLVDLLAPGLAERDLAVRCMQITAITVLTFGLAGYLGAALRSVHVFGWSAAIYIAYNVGILASIGLLHRQLGVLAAGIGVALGSVLMVAVQAPAFLRRLHRATLAGRISRPEIALIAFVPIGVYTLTRHAQVFVERILGSELAAGTISHLNYAQKVAQVPMVLAIMIATVTFPMLARSMAAGDEAGSRERVERDLQVVSAVVLVAAAYVIAFSEPIIQLLFQHGAFTAQDTEATADIMRVYAAGLLGQAAVGVLTRSYFSQRRAIWYPALVMTAGLALTVLISLALLPQWQGMALAAGNAAGITLTAGLLLTGLRRRVMSISVAAVVTPVARLLLAAGAAGVVGWLIGRLLSGQHALTVLIVGGFVVMAVFMALGIASGVDELRPLAAWPRRLVRPLGPDGQPVVLMYHSIDTGNDPYRITVSPARFEQQMEWLKRRGLRGTSMRELLDAADRGCAGRLVGLTFDDGYADFTTHALPVLARHGFTATVFVVAGKLGESNDWDEMGPTKPLMTADQVRAAARLGIEIGSHGVEHVRLSEADDDVLRYEIVGSRATLEAIAGAPVRGFCYPYGDVPDGVNAVRHAGYDYAVATRTTARRDRYALPRIYVGEGDGAARLLAKLIRHRLIWGSAQ